MFRLFRGIKEISSCIATPKSTHFFRNCSRYYFSDKQIEVAAQWWAKHFYENTEKNDSKPLPNDSHHFLNLKTLERMNQSAVTPVDKTQHDDFIKILSNKIRKLETRQCFGMNCIRFGDASDYEPPFIVQEAMREADINHSIFSLPRGVETILYENGQIKIGRRILSTNPDVAYYDAHTNFDSAVYMKIKGCKSKIIEIDVRKLKKDLYTGLYRRNLIETNLRPFNADKLGVLIYTKVDLRGFKESEEQFFKLTNEEWINILQDSAALKNYFDDLSLYYKKSIYDLLPREDRFHELGQLTLEENNNVAQYTTGCVKVISAPKPGSILYEDSLIAINQKDFLIQGRHGINALTKQFKGFEGYLCDEHGLILSPEAYKPGDDLPQLSQTKRAKL